MHPLLPPVSLKERRGARRLSELTPEVLFALNRGEIETKNLVEWLAVDMTLLLGMVQDELGFVLPRRAHTVAGTGWMTLGVMKRLEIIGRQLHVALGDHPRRREIWMQMSAHRSDIVREFAAFMIHADGSFGMAERLDKLRTFASDAHMGVREAAWFAFRDHLAGDLDRGLVALARWAQDADPNVRRAAVEGSRPRGVWCTHLTRLKKDPGLGSIILEPLRSDSSPYVRRSVGNWLNDASKSAPEWVTVLCARWEKESPTRETRWIVKHALRSMSAQTHGRGRP